MSNPTPSTPSPKSLTAHLLTLSTPSFTLATQSPFLSHAATNKLPKHLLSQWLANDLLYMRGYINLAGELLSIIKLPVAPASPNKDDSSDAVEHRLVDWLVDALVNIRREERFFVDVSGKYDIDVGITDENRVVDEERKNEGLKRFEWLFGNAMGEYGKKEGAVLPWLEGVVLFWATEKVYYTAWTWAREQMDSVRDGKGSWDDMADIMQKEFIPNWTNEEFKAFIERLEGILDDGVNKAVDGDRGRWVGILDRAEKVWRQVLDAEALFWPKVE
jgi:thiaminase